ncbi:MAG TPA: signal peptide peptidase SppA [Methylomirabilota bacterium]|nr:signal peptide peptidase SppA [Methylomirabilota bacterium]
MAGRGRTVLIALGITAGVLVFFFGSVLLFLSFLGDGGGFPGGQRVALIEVEGVILSGDEIVRELKEHLDNAAVRAVVVRINSPGGVVAPTQEIYQQIRKVRERGKPVVASLGSVAASGGYYIAAACDRIYANPGSLTGSIGVVMQLANLEGVLKKIGVEYVVVKAGRHKDIGNFSRTMTPEERKILQDLLDDVHGQFVNAVAEGRRLDRSEVLGFADGRIFSGQQAKDLKMVDALGGLEEAIDAAAKLGGIVGRPKILYPRKRFSVFDLMKNKLGLGAAPFAFPVFSAPLYLME